VSLTWPDIVIGGIALLFAFKGWRSGFVAELAGAVALFIAIIAAFRYNGALDGPAASLTSLGPGSTHVIGMVAFALAVYAIVMLIAWGLGRIARLPVLGIGNAIAGAVVGAGKALVVAWAVLYVVLFFPLTKDLRADLHRSQVVQLVTQPNGSVDDTLRGLMPWFVRPFMGPLFSNHRV
jgi:uncharacterized membrane protein required for colicin V production